MAETTKVEHLTYVEILRVVNLYGGTMGPSPKNKRLDHVWGILNGDKVTNCGMLYEDYEPVSDSNDRAGELCSRCHGSMDKLAAQEHWPGLHRCYVCGRESHPRRAYVMDVHTFREREDRELKGEPYIIKVCSMTYDRDKDGRLVSGSVRIAHHCQATVEAMGYTFDERRTPKR